MAEINDAFERVLREYTVPARQEFDYFGAQTFLERFREPDSPDEFLTILRSLDSMVDRLRVLSTIPIEAWNELVKWRNFSKYVPVNLTSPMNDLPKWARYWTKDTNMQYVLVIIARCYQSLLSALVSLQKIKHWDHSATADVCQVSIWSHALVDWHLHMHESMLGWCLVVCRKTKAQRDPTKEQRYCVSITSVPSYGLDEPVRSVKRFREGFDEVDSALPDVDEGSYSGCRRNAICQEHPLTYPTHSPSDEIKSTLTDVSSLLGALREIDQTEINP